MQFSCDKKSLNYVGGFKCYQQRQLVPLSLGHPVFCGKLDVTLNLVDGCETSLSLISLN